MKVYHQSRFVWARKCRNNPFLREPSPHGSMGLYYVANIKPDVTGWLTDNLHMKALARQRGFEVMVN
jgi:hypothetical protein